ncbi:MAG: immunoglobulin domain-containing protein [Limisphaerales bacterium]
MKTRLKVFFALAAIALALIPQAGAQNTNFIRFTQVAAGSGHSLALRSDGTVLAWGLNNSGQTDVPGGLNSVVAIAAAGGHNLALKSDDSVVAWGSIAPVPAGLFNVVAIAVGGDHNLALRSDGTVVAWGDNLYGQSTPPNGLANVVAIAAGAEHSLALKFDGTAVAWGYNLLGQSTVPSGLSHVIAIAAGFDCSLALKSDGTVVAWGFVAAPVPVGLSNVVAIAAGGYHSLALKSDGSVVAWGSNSAGETNVPVGLINVVAIAAGDEHSLALKSDGTIVGWGDDSYGQLPQPLIVTQPISQTSQPGTTANFSVMVTGIAPLGYQWLKDGTNVSGASGSVYNISNVRTNDAGNYSVVITNACGSVTSSNALLTVLTIPLITQQPQNQTPLWAGATAYFSVTVTGSAPLIYQWLKDGISISGATNSVYNISNVQTNNAGGYSVIITNGYGSVTSSNALLTALPQRPVQKYTPGTVVSWGEAGQSTPGTVVSWGEAGQSTPGTVVSWGEAGQSTVPDGLTDVVAIAAGGYFYPGSVGGGGFHSLALKSDGTVVAWGQIYTETGDYPIEPVPDGLNGVVAISASDFDSLALRFDGTVVAWGGNFYGETNTVPDGLSNIVAIAGGGGNNLALKSDGTVVAWGYSDQVQSTVPTGLTDVVAIAAAGGHNLALKSDGTVVAWGGNPVPDGLSNVVAIAAGDVHSLALKSDGTVVAWGDNRAGECTVPAGLTGVIAIAAAGVYDDWEGRSLGRSLALKSDGTLVAWGDNEDGAFTVPAGLNGVIAIAAGGYQSLALIAGTNQVIAPTILIQARSNGFLLSWPASVQGFVLQSTANLAESNSWTTATNSPVTFGSQTQVTDTIFGLAKFYRLKK